MASAPIPIVDSHIHLYPETELDSLAWYKPDGPVGEGARSVAEYKAASAAALAGEAQPDASATSRVDAAAPPSQLAGFILVEADRKNDESRDWEGPLAEVAWARRIVTGQPREGEGHEAGDAALCLAVVPWAPLPLGPERVEEYLARAEEVAGPETWARVRGFRYLLQDKPNGAGLAAEFIESLKLLGRRGYLFELGIDQHRRGKIQLEECVEMIDRAHEGVPEDDKVVFVLNHLCKPDLTVINPADPSFIAWRTAMFTLSKCTKTYMKLSGGFGEMPDALRQRSAEEIFDGVYAWLAVVLAAFGPGRIMFASDWPVCTVGVGSGAWEKWRRLVQRTCYMASLDDDEQALVWGGTAKKAYGIGA